MLIPEVEEEILWCKTPVLQSRYDMRRQHRLSTCKCSTEPDEMASFGFAYEIRHVIFMQFPFTSSLNPKPVILVEVIVGFK